MEDNAFITKFGYLSIYKTWFDNTNQKVIAVGDRIYNIDQLRKCITYRDNIEFYRWKPSDYRRADVS